MMKDLHKKFTVLLGCIFIFVAIFFVAISYEGTSSSALVNTSFTTKAIEPSILYPQSKVVESKQFSIGSYASKINEQEVSKSLLTEEERYKWELWRRERGYFEESDLDDYRAYDIGTLKKLALNGDQKALELVARHRMASGEEAHVDFYYAALHGSTHALVAMSYLIENKFMEELSDDEKAKYSISALAYLSVAGTRGDEYAASESAGSFKRRMKFNPTQEQQILIDEQANEIYKLLVSQRMEMGLPEFDNTPSPEMHKVLAVTRR